MIWKEEVLTKEERDYWKARHRSVHNYRRNKSDRSRSNCYICDGGPGDIAHILPIVKFGPYVQVGTIPTIFLCKYHHTYFDDIVLKKLFEGIDWRPKPPFPDFKFEYLDKKEKKIYALVEMVETAWKAVVNGGFKRQLHYDELINKISLKTIVEIEKTSDQLRWEEYARRQNNKDNINDVPIE